MLWLLVARGDAPIFTGMVQVRVGGLEEPAGKAGLAHMFEHMAFKGSADIGTTDPEAERIVLEKMKALEGPLADAQAKGNAAQLKTLTAQRDALNKEAHKHVVVSEVWQTFHTNGAAELNAFTSKDLTGYYARMPAEALDLWIYLTSEMVGRPVMREFYAERNVVMEERRSSVDNSPRGQLYEALNRTAFTTSPYRTMTIGSMEELQALTITDAEAFHARHYHPDRMVGTIVGNFDRDKAKEAIRRSFGSFAAPPVAPVDFPPEPPQTAERRVEVTFDAHARLMMAYHKPTLPHHDDYVFDAIQFVLCEGESGRLIRHLEQEVRVARNVGCWTSSPGTRLNNLFIVMAEPLGEHTPEAVIEAIESVFNTLRTELIAQGELTKARTNLRADFLWGLNGNQDLAQRLAYYQTVAGDWRYIVNHGAMMETITVEDIQDVAQRRLKPSQRTIAILRRPK